MKIRTMIGTPIARVAGPLLLAFAFACPLAGCATFTAANTGFPVEVSATPLDLSAVAGAADVLFVGGYELEGDRPEFGGFSGLVVEDGRRLVAISDRGFWWQQPIRLNAEGRVELGRLGRMGPLFDFGGKIAEGKERRDAEELAGWPGGQLVSYEGEHRVALYRRARAPHAPGVPAVAESRPRRLKVPAELDETYENGGIEAMTRLADGRLAIFSEEQVDRQGYGLLWVGEPSRGIWQRLRIERLEDFVPTSAATLPGGDLLLLERSYSENRGVRIRVRRLPADCLAKTPLAAGPPPPIGGPEIVRLEPPEAVDNFEGIEILPMADGRVFFLLLSDDNYSDTQRILLLQFELLSP